MKIVLITNHFPPIIDGVGDYTANLSHAFVKRGHKVYVICSSRKEICSEVSLTSNLQIFPVISDWSLKSMYKLAKQIKAIHPDYVSLQYVPYSFNYYGIPFKLCPFILLLRLSGHKVITTFHEIAIRLDLKKPKYILIAINQRLIAYFLALFSESCITSIEFYKEMLSFFKDKVHRIPIGSNITPFEAGFEKINTLNASLKPNNEFLICSFGANSKNYDLLLKIFTNLIPAYNIKLLIIGKLPEKVMDQIEVQIQMLKISKKIILTGYLSSEEVYLHLLCADAFLQLEDIKYNKWGGVSTKSGTLAAAYMAGLPIIGIRGDLTDNFFLDGENILLCNSSNAFSEITSHLINLIQSVELKNHLKKNSQITFQKNLQWDHICEKYCQVMKIK